MPAFDLTPPDTAQLASLIDGLDGEERRVLLQHGTEAPFCGVFLDNHRQGVYCCRLCGLPLFRSNAKFDSGTGWPSFFAPVDQAHVRRIRRIRRSARPGGLRHTARRRVRPREGRRGARP